MESQLNYDGVWGPVTATLDWCEANYQFSYYIAELANSFSNLCPISLAAYGGLKVNSESLPMRYMLAFVGFALVGIGSFAFHSTLLFRAQLADELPMIYATTFGVFMVFDTEHGFDVISIRTQSLFIALLIFDILFTWSYHLYRNPVYHQVVFAALVTVNVYRTTYLLKWSNHAGSIPQEAKHSMTALFALGAFLFGFGFFVWNLDNIFCDSVTRWKVAVGWPLAFFLEGHAWWHILTGAGTYLQLIGLTYVTLCVKDSHRNYTLGYSYGIPHVKRVYVSGSLKL